MSAWETLQSVCIGSVDGEGNREQVLFYRAVDVNAARAEDAERLKQAEARIAELEAALHVFAKISICEDEPKACYFGSGPYCGAHGDLCLDDEIIAARKALNRPPATSSHVTGK